MADEVCDDSSSTDDVTTPPKSNSDSEDSSEFNISLAGQHTYLSGDVQELYGCTVLPETEKMKIPILLCESVLFPLKTLPLSFEGNEITFIENHLIKSNAIVVAAVTMTSSNRVDIGCTAEIHNKSYNSIGEELTITTVGRQRVKIVYDWGPKPAPISYRLCIGQVQVLPDYLLQPIPPQIFNCPDTLLRSATCAMQFVKENNLDLNNKETKNILKPYTKFKRYETMIAFKRWTLRLFEEDELMQQAKSLFIEKLGQLPCEMTNDFTDFTYKFAGSLPFANKVLLDILKIDSPHQRLRYILKCLSHTTELHCIRCDSVITHSKHIFSMSQDGPLANYINLHGFVHDTLTVSEVLNTLYIGSPTSEHSWFPGYRWTMMNCAHCGTHLGWKFQASKLIPKMFYGLTRRAMKWEVP
ncbi:Protein cereblon isoform X2 [Oopsacas minuta]|uniref:Protein cereblon n=1 Tax=Oopsacas minuta TaxID=111878 RepID=A0AAV7JM31_9METZ|nr:Protein cereblon isoform X2 [Oopsacas minuta]